MATHANKKDFKPKSAHGNGDNRSKSAKVKKMASNSVATNKRNTAFILHKSGKKKSSKAGVFVALAVCVIIALYSIYYFYLLLTS
jgi:uncharacterized membrane protein